MIGSEYVSWSCPYLESPQVDVPCADTTADTTETPFYILLSIDGPARRTACARQAGSIETAQDLV